MSGERAVDAVFGYLECSILERGEALQEFARMFPDLSMRRTRAWVFEGYQGVFRAIHAEALARLASGNYAGV